MKLYYIANEKIYTYDGKKTDEIPGTVLEGYTARLYQSAKSQEWKTQGSGARFTETYDPYSAEDRIQNISVFTDCVQPTKDGLLYSQTIDGISGLYIKKDGADDGIIFSDASTVYTDFDEYKDEIVIAAEYAGESHLAICPKNSVYIQTVTEGETLDSYPVWSRFETRVIYYASAGLELRQNREPIEKNQTAMGRILEAEQTVNRRVGPTSLCRFDVENGEIRELCSDPKYDYLRPQTDSSGNLYFIKKPYTSQNSSSDALGCFLDILLFPFRLCRALLGFLNFFSMAFSGKSIRKSGSTAAKSQDEKKLYLDGNLIDAEKELKANRKKGDKNPGIIPRSYELCRMAPNGEVTVLKKGIVAFAVGSDGIYCSNGSSIIKLDETGNETLITKATHVTKLTLGEEVSA